MENYLRIRKVLEQSACAAGMIQMNVSQEYVVNVGRVDVLLLQGSEELSRCGRGSGVDDGDAPFLNNKVDGVELRPYVVRIDCGDAAAKLSVARRFQLLSSTVVTPSCEKLNVCIAPLSKFVGKTPIGKYSRAAVAQGDLTLATARYGSVTLAPILLLFRSSRGSQMKKWLVGLLVLLALLVLISPGIVGMLAERELNEAVSQAELDTPEISVTTERFDREWFTSAGRHRIELRGGEMYAVATELAREAGQQRAPALIINTQLEHGIWPTGAARNSESFLPVLARSVSTMQLEVENGDIVDIPGTLYTEVGLTGATNSHYILESGSFDAPDTSVDWAGADLLLSVSASGTALSVSGTIEPWSVRSLMSGISTGAVTIDVRTERTRYGINVGDLDLAIESVSLIDANQNVELRELRLVGSSDISGGRLSGNSALHVGSIAYPSLGDISIDLELTASEVDAESLQTIVTAIDAAESSPDPNIAMADIDQLIEDDLQMLLSRGASISIDKFDVTLAEGTMNGSLTLDLPQSDASDLKSWARLALLLTASANISIDDELLRFAQSMAPELGGLIAMGYLRLDGGRYTLSAEAANGTLTINGAPMSIPMTGF